MPVNGKRKKTPAQLVLGELTKGCRPSKLKVGKQSATLYGVSITPDLAEKILAVANWRNRVVRQTAVINYAAEMKAGRWILEYPLAASSSGELTNGQHRLLAVKLANVEIGFLLQVEEDKHDKARLFADGEIVPRNLADILHFHGVADSKRTAPVLLMERNFRISHSPFQHTRSTRREYVGLYEDMTRKKNVFRLAFDAIPKGFHNRLSLSKAVVDWFSLQLVQADPRDAEVFFGLALNPSELKEHDAPYVLHQTLLEFAARRARSGAGDLPRLEQGTMLVKAWNRYYLNEPVKPAGIKYRIREEFPAIEGL